MFVGLACDDETEGPEPLSMTEVLPLSSGLVVTVAGRAWRIDTTTPAICCTASDDKPPVGYEFVGADTQMNRMNEMDTTGTEVAGG